MPTKSRIRCTRWSTAAPAQQLSAPSSQLPTPEPLDKKKPLMLQQSSSGRQNMMKLTFAQAGEKLWENPRNASTKCELSGTGNSPQITPPPLITPRNVFPVYGETFHVDCFEAHNAPKIAKKKKSPESSAFSPSTESLFPTQTHSSKPDHFNWPSSQTKIAHNSGSLKVSSPAPIHHSAGRGPDEVPREV